MRWWRAYVKQIFGFDSQKDLTDFWLPKAAKFNSANFWSWIYGLTDYIFFKLPWSDTAADQEFYCGGGTW